MSPCSRIKELLANHKEGLVNIDFDLRGKSKADPRNGGCQLMKKP